VKPLHLQTAYKHYMVAPGGLPVSEALPSRILSLPMHAYLSDEDQERIISAIREFHGK
jgi:dTDP-4-amino-4,6-dideoxygalactose transaminase